MSITPEVHAQSPEREAHDKVLDNDPDRIAIWDFFSRRGGNRMGRTRRKISRRKDNKQTNKQTHI